MRTPRLDLKDRGKYVASPAHWWPAGLGLLVGAGFVGLANHTGDGEQMATWWTNWLDPGITITTLIAAVALSIWSAIKAWEDNLEKRLDVHCTYNGRYVASCWEASLAHEGDIRQWGQQIGRQMFGGTNLKFTVTPTFYPPENRGDNAGIRRVYTIEIELTDDPTQDGRYIVWDPRNGRHLVADVRPDHPLQISSPELRPAEPSL